MPGDGMAGADGVRCGCHGSHFDKIGRVLEGPANEPLAHYQVDIEVNGDIYVIAGTKVPSDTRTVVLEAPPPPPL
jgi:Rieske Fe-S protein